MNSTFKVYIADGQENFIYQKNDKMVKTAYPFSQSLLELLYLDMDSYDAMFEEMGAAVQKLYATGDERLGERVRVLLEEFSKAHIYFEFLYADWVERLGELQQKNNIGMVELLPYRRKLTQLPSHIRALQAQIGGLLEQVLDITTSDKPISEKMAKYVSPKDGNTQSVFQFAAQTTRLELVDKKLFTEVLYPADFYEIVEFLVRACIQREQRFRVCKNCNQYFPLTGYLNAEYCDHPFDEQGHTCKEMGALNVWQKKAKQPSYELYSKEYKKRFARIKYGKITKEDFYAWAEQARVLRDQCMNGELELEKLQEWIAAN